MTKFSTLRARRAARAVARAPRHYPVVLVDGAAPPVARGRSFYFTTPSGRTIVHHPNAYGWRTRYWPSTHRVEVGRESLFALAWLAVEGKGKIQ